MKEIMNQLKALMIEAAERDGNYDLAERLRQYIKEEEEKERKREAKILES